MVVSASLVSYQRPFSCHPSSPFLVIPVFDTGSPYDLSYGLADKERHRNRRLFGLHGVGNQNRKNMN